MAAVAVHLIAFQEAEIIPYSIRHYATFCDRVIVHDGGSTDGTRDIARSLGAEVRDFITAGIDDRANRLLKEQCVMSCQADWCIVADADEMWFAPEGPAYTLESYDAQGIAVVKPIGIEMFSDEYPTGPGQITDYVRDGAEDRIWGSKPLLTAPKRLASIVYSAGCHTCWAVTKGGVKINDPQEVTTPESYCLHFHHLGGVERIARRYAAQQARHSKVNIANRWGNYKLPMDHTLEKRAMIVKGLWRVIP